jgi:hypothetical protein
VFTLEHENDESDIGDLDLSDAESPKAREKLKWEEFVQKPEITCHFDGIEVGSWSFSTITS